MQLVAGVAILVMGLFLALITDLDESASDMRLCGWILVAVGVLGLILTVVVGRLGRRGWLPH
jgi:hypothetical protein